ncbi:unnamed protein product [Rotaria sp. Silwood1]|nr:unnamed protein product [Rotaria sp. Silwood1]
MRFSPVFTQKLQFLIILFSLLASTMGSEAAAATAVIITHHGPSLPPPQPIEFKADRPFLFFIRESRQNIVLFSGKFISPPINS